MIVPPPPFAATAEDAEDGGLVEWKEKVSVAEAFVRVETLDAYSRSGTIRLEK